MDPLEFRWRNRAKEGTRRIDGGVHQHIGCSEVLESARSHPHYSAPLEGANRGRGVAFGTWGNWGAESSSSISVNSDGTVALLCGSVDVTGTRTSLAMQVAETLGLSLDDIQSTVGDTDSIGYTQVSAGSRTTVASGHAVIKAARDVIDQMRERAASIWDLPADQVSFQAHAPDGPVFVSENHSTADRPHPPEIQRLTFRELAGMQMQTGGAITGVGNVNIREWGVAFGAHIVDLVVDPETGKVTLLRYTVVQDVGQAVHPTQVEGQMQGGATQGIGWALYEGYQYDEQGKMLNPNLLDYKLPTALDVPPIDTVIVEVPYPNHPYGLRGVGEMPIVPPPAAIANAIYRATGAQRIACP